MQKKVLTLALAVFGLWGCSGEPEPVSEVQSAHAASEQKDAGAEKEEQTVISFIGVGDNLIHDSVFRDAELADGSYDFKPIYENVAKDIEQADIAFLNQETIIAGDDYAYSGYPAFNTPPEIAQDMSELGFDLVNGATNHALDYDYPGALNSLAVWNEQKDIVYTGIFASEADRNAIRTIEREGVTFSFLAYTYGTNGIEPDTTYRVSYFDEEQIRQDVAKAKSISDVVIVSAHWGDENTQQISEMQRTYARLFADLEVDVVIGTHPHILQPIEWVTGERGNETLVVYSLGNFVAHSLTDYNTLGGMVTFDFVVAADETVTVENVRFDPTVSHYVADRGNVESTRHDFKIYKLEDYTEELALEHGLNGYNGLEISPENYLAIAKAVIPAEMLD
ncbi:CapA family protein [Trichococcus ilyis]|uniref:Capsule synthesis protein capa n=1 Tax=Trichococcus ilyis TaxID=640938 RepID=A0A143YCB2_9LACT|nr:CapA family protein [Trichococcus ilyis]CZQ87284.1 capsule synthesis protein capa [Trichococcus ilyis]SEI64321.1 poly-gamma-glutamate synthesis protein (capsule biosynthesis protein) [Trichococcus ilyis]